LRVETLEDELARTLIAAGVLDPTVADDPAAISAALVRQLAILGWLAQHQPGILIMLRRMAGD
jgi:hypothetical protein